MLQYLANLHAIVVCNGAIFWQKKTECLTSVHVSDQTEGLKCSRSVTNSFRSYPLALPSTSKVMGSIMKIINLAFYSWDNNSINIKLKPTTICRYDICT